MNVLIFFWSFLFLVVRYSLIVCVFLFDMCCFMILVVLSCVSCWFVFDLLSCRMVFRFFVLMLGVILILRIVCMVDGV